MESVVSLCSSIDLFVLAGRFSWLCCVCLAQSLQSLADLRSTPHFPFSGEVDLAVGAAVESMGPEVVLGAVPLNITGVE